MLGSIVTGSEKPLECPIILLLHLGVLIFLTSLNVLSVGLKNISEVPCLQTEFQQNSIYFTVPKLLCMLLTVQVTVCPSVPCLTQKERFTVDPCWRTKRGAREMAQYRKYLLHKHKDWSSDLSTHISACDLSSWGGRDTSPQWRGRDLMSTSGLYMYLYTCTLVHVKTYAHHAFPPYTHTTTGKVEWLLGIMEGTCKRSRRKDQSIKE